MNPARNFRSNLVASLVLTGLALPGLKGLPQVDPVAADRRTAPKRTQADDRADP